MAGWKLSVVIVLALAGCAGEAPKDEARARPAKAEPAKAEPAKAEPKPAAKAEPAKAEPKPAPAKAEPKPAPAQPGAKAEPKPAPAQPGAKAEPKPAQPGTSTEQRPARPKTDEELLAEVEARMALEDVGDPSKLGGKPIRGPETDEDRIERLKRQALILDEVAVDPATTVGRPQRVRSRVQRDHGVYQPLVERVNKAIDAGRWDDYAACFSPAAQRAMAAELTLLLCVGAAAYEGGGRAAEAEPLWRLVGTYGIEPGMAQTVGRRIVGLDGAAAGQAWIAGFRAVHDGLSDPRRTLVEMNGAMATQEKVDLFLLLDGPLVAGEGGQATAHSRGRPPMAVRVVGQGARQVVDFEGPDYCRNMLQLFEAKGRGGR